MMRVLARRAALVLGAALVALSLSGCSVFGPPQSERADTLARTLEAADIGVTTAEATYQSSFAGGLTVTVTLSPAALDADVTRVSAKTLTQILHILATETAQMRVATTYLYTQDEQAQAVSLAAAAKENGLRAETAGDSLALSRGDLTAFADR